MKDVNRVTIAGRVAQDLHDRSYYASSSGVSRLSFSIASNAPKKTQDGWEDEASFFDIVVWGKQADNLKNKIAKGAAVLIDGSLRQERWEDKQTGQKRSAVHIYADYVQLLKTGERKQEAQKEFEDDYPF